MITDVLKSSSVERLRGILKDRYGLGLRINFLVDSQKINSSSEGFSVASDNLEIPIVANGRLMATAVVPSAGRLSNHEHSAITEMIRLVLEPALYLWFMAQTEHNLHASKSPSTAASVLFDVREVEAFEDTPDRMNLIASIFRLQSTAPTKNKELIRRMSINIHEVTERWAYLQLSDVREGIKTVEDLKQIGPITLFVENESDISYELAQIFSQFALESDPSQHPLILIGATSSRADFDHPLQCVTIDADRLPLESRQLRQTLTMLLDREATLI